jgi:RES domain-containing protein
MITVDDVIDDDDYFKRLAKQSAADDHEEEYNISVWVNDTEGLRRLKRKPYEEERMTPQPYKTKEGRINPKGIPCLYAATNLETAIYEVRPPANTVVSVAELLTNKPLKLIDCTQRRGAWGYSFSDPESELWYAIDRAFSYPVSDADDIAEYAPTQVLAETFRKEELNGIIYDSSLSDSGKNVALFNIYIAHVVSVTLHKVKAVAITSELIDHTKPSY